MGWLDNYGKEENYNDSQTSAPQGFQGDGYSNKGRNYSPAWGGQFQEGGEIPNAQSGRATRADSLAVYNKSKEVENFYKKRGYNKSNPEEEVISYLKSHKIKELNDLTAKKYNGKATPVDASNNIMISGITKSNYRKNIDKNKYLQRELQTNTINASAPMQLFDNRIEPKGLQSYYRSDGDGVDIFSYNTIANKPFDLLTEKEKVQRVKLYGTDGVPKSYLNKSKPATTVKPSTKKSIVDPKKKPIVNPTKLNVEGLQPMSVGLQDVDNGFETNLDIPTPAQRQPKYYDIHDINNQNFGGGDTQYRVDSLDELRELPKEQWERKITPHYQMGGNVYPVNYVPQAQGGISMPGATGSMYARIGVPSNGPYAKKTMASAQNGAEMRYYQNGLDWKPKGMRDGGWLDGYEKAQNGIQQLLKDNKRRIDPLRMPVDKEEQSNEYRKLVDTKKYKDAIKAEKLANDRAIIADRKERIAKSNTNPLNKGLGIFQPSNWTRKNWAESTGAIGDKFRIFPNDPDSFVDEWLNPGVSIGGMASDIGTSPMRAKQENSYMSYITATASPLLTGALEWVGTTNNKQFVNNLVNPFNIVPGYSSAEKYLGNKLGNVSKNVGINLVEAIPSTKNIKKTLSTNIDKLQKTNSYKALDEHVSGLMHGLRDKTDTRPFFEKFPITNTQKARVYAEQDKALEEGTQFIKDWHYGDDIDLHPDIVDKMRELDPNFRLSIFDNTNLTNTSGPYANPFSQTKDALVSTRRNILKNEDISDDAKQYILNNRNRIGGVNMGDTNESITLRNRGLYHYPPSTIKETVIHEGGHTSEKLGTVFNLPERNASYTMAPFDRIRTVNPLRTSYAIPNAYTEQGKIFDEAMVETIPHVFNEDGEIIKKGFKWEASPGELHSELLPARSNLIDAYVAQGQDRKEIMDMLRADASDAQIDWMIQNKNLNRFFKETTSPELKRKAIRMLYAGVPAATGLNALTGSEETSSKMKRGGVIKDDRGQWDHPGEITEINSNNITMQGVPYPVLGISDTGHTQMMYPGQDYKFKGKKVTEYPIAKNGVNQADENSLVKLNQLHNFTNYNTKQPGGWLSKYE